tara:strand:- start:92 stop:451 length:360 start_codon:yes stop_codon:yes gene_type:complete
MNLTQLSLGIGLFIIMHILVWFSGFLQFVNEYWESKSLIIALLLSLPITTAAYYAAQTLYGTFENSAWAVRFIGFGTSYLVFPLLTWVFLNESVFTPKMMVCIVLSLLIISIQIFWKSG